RGSTLACVIFTTVFPWSSSRWLWYAFGVNYLGHFLLTSLLLEQLKQCGPSSVVTVAALLHRLGGIDFSLLASQKYLVSCHKLCNVLFTRELANRLVSTSVTCYSLHPGQCLLQFLDLDY
uniref:Uncharacterized protein n=1 Tax=Amphilophus citrinellus TaxID=61819 RepID=A0A3Q0RGM2_AMPCI